jgi:sulfate adenylyltransferase subunit 2
MAELCTHKKHRNRFRYKLSIDPTKLKGHIQPNMSNYKLTHLKELESESIFILREVAAQFEKPALLFSGGKDSIVMAYLAYKAFYPAAIPFPFVHIDTGHNFEETITYRDDLVKLLGAQLIVGSVEDSIAQGRVVEEKGFSASRNKLQTTTLLDTLEKYKFDAALGGARRDEEKARAKERFFSHRDEFGQWDPKNQRPELWNIFNGKKNIGEHFRVFPISNWTEMDVWQYILQENIPLPSLYYTHEREVFERDGIIYAALPEMPRRESERIEVKRVRCRTIGDITCTGLTLSSANSLEDIIDEIASSRITERGGRSDDKRSEAAMEDRKKAGYF